MRPVHKLVARLTAVYGTPRTDDPETFITEFVRAMDGYDAEVLDEAGAKMIASLKFWPRPSEARAAADAVAAKRFRPAPLAASADLPPPSPEQVERAAELVRSLKAGLVDAGRIVGTPPPAPFDASRDGFAKAQRSSCTGLLRRPASIRGGRR